MINAIKYCGCSILITQVICYLWPTSFIVIATKCENRVNVEKINCLEHKNETFIMQIKHIITGQSWIELQLYNFFILFLAVPSHTTLLHLEVVYLNCISVYKCNYADRTTAFLSIVYFWKIDIIIRKLNECDNFLLYFTIQKLYDINIGIHRFLIRYFVWKYIICLMSITCLVDILAKHGP